MAPALNEPMNPTEKLANSTAKSLHPSCSIRSVSDSESTTPPAKIDKCLAEEQKESRPRSFSVTALTPSVSSRVTRSKDAYQRVFEQTVSSPISVTQCLLPTDTVTECTEKKSSISSINKTDEVVDNESQALNESRTNNELVNPTGILSYKGINSLDEKNNAKIVLSELETCDQLIKTENCNININNNNNTSISCKSNSTEQLLADLTNDIEEAITTKVCIRKEKTGDKKSSNVSTFPTSLELETNDKALIRKIRKTNIGETNVGENAIIKLDSKIEVLQYMKSENKCENVEKDNVKEPNPKSQAQRETSIEERGDVGGDEATVPQTGAFSDPKVITSAISAEVCNAGPVIARKPEANQRLQILSVDVLPPISTDSTMTASEVEDNLEERLSQLDGTAVSSPIRDEVNTGVEIGTIPTTPPRTPLKQQTHQQQVKQLHQQLQHTPPTPQQNIHQQQQQHSFTPQSTSSANTINSANLPPAFMKETGAGELEDQDIEEVLKVLKGFDGSAGADTLCDLNVLFNEEYTLINYEEVSSQQPSTSTKPSPLKEMQIEIERNQQTMHRRIDFLLRRMRKVQSRYMSKHCSEEIAGLFEWTARIYANKGGNLNVASNLLQTDTPISVMDARPHACNWTEEKNPLSSTQISAMLRRLEQSSNAQQLCTVTMNNNLNSLNTQLPLRKSKKAILQESLASTSSGTTSLSSPVERKGEVVVPNYDINVSEEISQVAGLLQTEMREVQMAMDSDATESSSGGESADEMVTYNNQIQQPLAIAKRAAWRYSRDRAAIAARWSWLLSQIADLEIKIRQQTELRQEIVRTKGAIVCDAKDQEIHHGIVKSTEATGNTAISSVNGYKGNIVGNFFTKMDTEGTNETCLLGAARTRGFESSLFRKRKLFQTQSLHTISKKAARPSNIKCGCQWPLNPCTLCTGRIDPTAPRDTPDTMMMADRIALLDPGYHPVLSFREDVSSAMHLEAIARMSEWQQRVMRCQVKSIAKSVWKAEREAERAAGHNTSKKYNEPAAKRRYIKKKDRLAAEERNAAAAAAVATVMSTTTNPHNTSSASITSGLTTDSTPNLPSGIGIVGGGKSGALADIPTPSQGATTKSALLPTYDNGNGTGILSTSSTTTPLVANKSAKNSKKLHHYHLVGDGVLLEPPRPLSPVLTNHSSHSLSSHHSQQSGNSTYIHQTSDNLPQNFDQYNPNPIHSSLISNSNGISGSGGGVGIGGGSSNCSHKNNNKYRKSSSLNLVAAGISNSSGSNSIGNSNISNHCFNGDPNDANWDACAPRSRASSPTHASSYYYKYERSKNRTSYDIDNIVIPYSVAAATRVEILPYKEIPTPKWRVIDDDRGAILSTSESAMDTTPNDEAKKIDHCENRIVLNLSSNDSTTVKATKIFNEGNDGIIAIVKKAAIGNSKEEPYKSSLNNLNISSGNMEDLMKNDFLSMDSTKITELRKNKFDNDESKGIKTDNLNLKAVFECEEPEVKKLKTENFTENKHFCTDVQMASDIIESKKENIGDLPTVTTKISKAKVMVNSKRGIRLKRIRSTKLEECVDEDHVGESSEIEDITDDSIMLRHERALAEERRKFKTYLKFPWSTRSRANRRIDSRAESSGANTPDPTSPAPQTTSIGCGDQESIPSPLAPSTPLNPLDTITEINGDNGTNNPSLSSIGPATGNNNCNGLSKHLERRRTISLKKDRDSDRRSSTPDPKELVPPYEPLSFPLTDEAFEGLLKAMPVEFHCLDFDSKYLEDCSTSSVPISTKYSRQRNIWRGESLVNAGSRRGKSTSTMQNCDLTCSRRQRLNNNLRRGGSRRRGRGNNSRSRIKTNGTTFGSGRDVVGDGDGNGGGEILEEEDEDDDDEFDLLALLAEEDADYDYPKHHLAPDNDDLFDDASVSGGMLNYTSRNSIMNIDDEYDAYLGRQHRDSDGCTTDSEPFADDDPNDPEWRGESEERNGGGSTDRYRRSLR